MGSFATSERPVLLGWLHGDCTGVAQMHASLKPGLSDSGWEGGQEPASQGAYKALNGIGDQVWADPVLAL